MVRDGNREMSLANALDGIRLSSNELARAKARMTTAESIAAGALGIADGVAATGTWAHKATRAAARRIRAAFTKPAHS